MRSLALAAVLGILIVGAPLAQAHAEGEVLVPDDVGKGTPNLGLTPDSGSSPAPPATPTVPTPYTVPHVSTPGASFPATSSFPPTPVINGAPTVTTQTIQSIMSQMPHTTLPSSSATQVVNVPDSLLGPKTWNNIDVSVDPKWKTRSEAFVTDRLGINGPDVPSMCHIGASGMIRTDKNSAVFDTGASSSSTARYAGKMSAVIATVKALCNATSPLPANKGMIFQVGDKYVVSLGTAQCQPTDPNKPSHGIAISFTDEGAPQCSIQ